MKHLVRSALGTVALITLLAPAVAQAQAAEPNAPQPRQSWTADRRAFQIGDVVTVLVDEYTLASANQGDFASDRRSRDMNVSAGQNITPAFPSARAGVGSSNDAESRRRGEATRQNRFTGEMTARVVEVGPGGLLRIEGSKSLHVDRAREELAVSGWVRPQDISSRNIVESWRIGDAELVYSSSGLASPRGGFVTRILGWIWP